LDQALLERGGAHSLYPPYPFGGRIDLGLDILENALLTLTTTTPK